MAETCRSSEAFYHSDNVCLKNKEFANETTFHYNSNAMDESNHRLAFRFNNHHASLFLIIEQRNNIFNSGVISCVF